MRLTPTGGATNPPISLAEVKAALQVIHASDDARLSSLIAGAVASLSGRVGITGRQLGTQAWRLDLDGFPAGALVLPLPPLQSVQAVTYVDAAGATQTLAQDAYTVDTASEPGRIVPLATWPQAASVAVEFTAGHGAETPEPLKQAICLQVEDWYNGTDKNAAAVDRLVFPYRMLSL